MFATSREARDPCRIALSPFSNIGAGSEIAPGDLETGQPEVIAPEPHDLVAILEDHLDGVFASDVALVDLPFDDRVLATIAGAPQVETRHR